MECHSAAGFRCLNFDYIKEVIERAERGDPAASREALELLVACVDAKRYNEEVFTYFSAAIRLFLDDGVDLETSLGLDVEPDKGGRPRKYEKTEIAATDFLLRNFADMRPEQANEWIANNVGADRRFVQRIRKRYSLERFSQDDLLMLAGSLREKVARVLPQT